MVNSETGYEKENLEHFKTLSSIIEAYRIYGVYDIIVLVEEQNMALLKETIFHHIRMTKGVKATLTLLIV